MLACVIPFAASASTNNSKKDGIVKSVFSGSTFDKNAEKLPPYFGGLDLQKAISALSDKEKLLQKSQFEKQSEYEARIKSLTEEKKLYGNVTTDSVIAISAKFGVEKFSYDPENERLIWKLRLYEQRRNDDADFITQDIDTGHNLKVISQYHAQNAYGARTLVSRVRNTNDRVRGFIPRGTEGLTWEDAGYDLKKYFYNIKMSISTSDAKKVIDDMFGEEYKFLFIGILETPYLRSTITSLGAATIDSPIEGTSSSNIVFIRLHSIWIYHVRTGNVVGKQDIKPVGFWVQKDTGP